MWKINVNVDHGKYDFRESKNIETDDKKIMSIDTTYQLACYIMSLTTDDKDRRIIRHALNPSYQSHLDHATEIEQILRKQMEERYSYLDEKIFFRQLSSRLRETYQNTILNFFDLEKKKEILNDLYYYFFFQLLGIKNIGPYLIDDMVHEIYIEKNGQIFYLDHEKWGRCFIANTLSLTELKRFLSIVLLENDAHLSRLHPSFKGDLVSDDFHLRVSVDASPLSIDGLQLDVRKIFPYHFHLFRLLAHSSISPLLAAMLIVAMRFGATITIIGPPNTGKTTVQNNLLQFLPFYWRVISIEDVIESPPQLFSTHLRLKISTADERLGTNDKILESLKLLHRSPDYVNLGEISNEKHAKAWFRVLAAGIPSIQTIHGKNMQQLMIRLQEIYKIPPILIKSSIPHLLVEMHSFWHGGKKIRRISAIGEIKNTESCRTNDQDNIKEKTCNNNQKVFVTPLCTWSAEENNWVQLINFIDSDTIHYIVNQLGYRREMLQHLIENIRSVIDKYYKQWMKKQKSKKSLLRRSFGRSYGYQNDKHSRVMTDELIKRCYQTINDLFQI